LPGDRAMATVTSCPRCSEKLRLPDELRGKPVRCPQCSTVFEAANGSPPPTPTPAPRPAGLDVPLDLSLDDPGAAPQQPGTRSRSQPVGAVEVDAPAPNNAPAPPSPPPAEEPDPPRSRPSRSERPERKRDNAPEDDRVRCPICRRANEPDARRCYHCGERLAEGTRPRRPDRDGYDDDYGHRRRRRDTEPHRGGTVLAMGLVSLVGIAVIPVLPVIAGIIGWVMGHTDLRKMRNHAMDPEGEGMTRAGWICSIIGTLLNLLILLACGGMFGMMIWAESANAPKTSRSFGPPRATMPVKQPNWNPPIKDQVKDGK